MLKFYSLIAACLLAFGCEHNLGPDDVLPPQPPAKEFLGASSGFAILAGSTVTCVTGGQVDGSIGISPGEALTGFGPCELSGEKHLGDAVAAKAQDDLRLAMRVLGDLPCSATITSDLGGQVLSSGVYCAPSSIGLTGDLTLDGDGVYVFKAGSSLTIAGSVKLQNGASAKNVFWLVGSSATLGTDSKIKGNILAYASITFNARASLCGRALARTAAVTLGAGNVVEIP